LILKTEFLHLIIKFTSPVFLIADVHAQYEIRVYTEAMIEILKKRSKKFLNL